MGSIRVKAEPEQLDAIQCFAAEQLEESGFDLDACTQVEIAIEEIFTNIVTYTAKLQLLGVEAECSIEPGRVVVECFRQGEPCDLLKMEHLDIADLLAYRKEQRLTAFMARELPDILAYEYREGKNIVTIKKR